VAIAHLKYLEEKVVIQKEIRAQLLIGIIEIKG